jgi:hypothetical protein
MFIGTRLESEMGSNFWVFALFGSGYAGLGSGAFFPRYNPHSAGRRPLATFICHCEPTDHP